MENINYSLLDSGDGHLLEKIGENTIIRPENTAIWQPQKQLKLWQADARCEKKQDGKWTWETGRNFKSPWYFTYNSLKFELRFSNSKNVGIFPEQVNNWDWLSGIIKNSSYQPNVLNLFAYSGGATLVCAKAGASLCHVDASKSVVAWASKNQELSGLSNSKIRWIVDDCMKFLEREVKRGNFYDGIILDPPAFGRASGITFKFEDDIAYLLKLCKSVLSKKPLFFLLNSYSMGYSPQVIKNLVLDFFPQYDVECGELLLQEYARKRNFSCSVFARFHT